MRILNQKIDAIPPDAVYVGRGRGSRFGNRYVIGRDGDRDQVIELYRRWLWREIRAGRITRDDLRALDGHDLVCWCHPKPCHAEVLRRAVRWACTH